MNWYDQTFWASILLVIAATFTGGLGFFVVYNNPRRLTHQLFALLAGNLTLWTLGVLTIIHSNAVETASAAITATFVVACFLPATFYHFVSQFPRRREYNRNVVLRLLYTGGVILALLAFTPWHLASVEVFPEAPPKASYGPVFSVFPLLILVSMVAMLYDLVQKLRRARDIERRQVQYVMLGIFATTILGTATNVIAPFLNVANTEIYGPCFTVLMAGIFSYAMLRYHLLDVWILVSRATVYGIITALTTVVFFGTVSTIHWLSLTETLGSSFISSLLSAVTVVLLILPLKEYVQLIANRTILRRHYDEARLIERLIRMASETVQLDVLLRTVAEEVISTLGVTRLRIYLVEEGPRGKLIQAYPSGTVDAPLDERESSAFIAFLREHPVPVSSQEMRYHSNNRMAHEPIAAMLDARLARILVPLRSKSGPIGMMLLGEKDSHDMYSQQDHHVFRSVAGTIATAIENARLYERLEKVNLHLERIMESMRAGVVAIDPMGEVTTVNEEARAMLGPLASGDKIDGAPPKIAQMLRRTLEERRGIADVETVITGPEGDLIPVAMSSSYFQTSSSVAAGAMVILFNLTQIKRLESSVQRADRLTSIGTMAAGMAHEIKNPLQSIKTFTQLLTKRYDDADFRTTFVEVVPPEVQRIDDIVTRLLNFARPTPVEFLPQDLEQIVRDVLALMANQLKKCDITVKAAFPPEARPVLGDGQQLKQVFLNLFLNAVDAMENNAERLLNIRVHYGYCHVMGRDSGELEEVPCAKISISDTGCGVNEENLRQLFNPFFTTKAHGSGLGLSVVHSIILEHHGEIDVTSAPGVGTTFFLVLPLARASAFERMRV
ncbi:MAG: hypothetical protein RLZZ303_3596 [Candidatus Hydrogenedentota bacterium]|jgi:two-component system nitrogen regulation sensor histidine kinase GlnL